MGASATSQTIKENPPSQAVQSVLQEAMKSYEEALKAGIQFQEESLNLWKGLLASLSSKNPVASQFESLNCGLHSEARKNLDEMVENFNRSSSRTAELFRKALSYNLPATFGEAQEQLQALVEHSLSNLHSNIQAALSMNSKIVNSWKEIAGNLIPQSK